MDGIIDESERATLGFVNPASGDDWTQQIFQTSNDGPTGVGLEITMAVKESPVPGPGALLLLCLGLGGGRPLAPGHVAAGRCRLRRALTALRAAHILAPPLP